MFDLIIIGGSAAATAAGIYAARRGFNPDVNESGLRPERRSFKIICKEFGGEVATSGEIGNWPGVIQTDGIVLADQFKEHLKSYGVAPEEGVEVQSVIKQEDGTFCITVKKDGPKMASDKLPDGNSASAKCDYTAKAVIMTTGVHPRQLNVPGEKEFRNKGVSYCSVCDGPLFRGKITITLGGGNSGLESALMLADIASKVYVMDIEPKFRGDDILIEALGKKPNVEMIFSAATTEILGDKFVTGLRYKDKEGEIQELKADGVFIHIGQIPNSALAPTEVEKDQFGQIKVNAKCETNLAGFFAAGDVTDVPYKQIVVATGQGCIAALAAVEYLNRQK